MADAKERRSSAFAFFQQLQTQSQPPLQSASTTASSSTIPIRRGSNPTPAASAVTAEPSAVAVHALSSSPSKPQSIAPPPAPQNRPAVIAASPVHHNPPTTLSADEPPALSLLSTLAPKVTAAQRPASRSVGASPVASHSVPPSQPVADHHHLLATTTTNSNISTTTTNNNASKSADSSPRPHPKPTMTVIPPRPAPAGAATAAASGPPPLAPKPKMPPALPPKPRAQSMQISPSATRPGPAAGLKSPPTAHAGTLRAGSASSALSPASERSKSHTSPVPPPPKSILPMELPAPNLENSFAPPASPNSVNKVIQTSAAEMSKHRSVPVPPSSAGAGATAASEPGSPSHLRRFREVNVVRYDRTKSVDASTIAQALDQSNLSRRSSLMFAPPPPSPSSSQPISPNPSGQSGGMVPSASSSAIETAAESSGPMAGGPRMERPGSMMITKMELNINTANKVIEETILTERDYVHDLTVFIELYLYPLRAEKSISAEDLTDLFVNIEDLLPVNQRLLDKFAALSSPTAGQVAECFESVLPDFRLYTHYCARQDQIVHVMNRLIETNKTFDTFLEYNRLRPECRNLKFDSFSIKPIQRLCKYPLLLKEIGRSCEENSPDIEKVNKVKEGIEAILMEINTAKAEVDKMREIDEKLSKMSKEVRALNLMNPRAKRTVLVDGPVSLIVEDKKSKKSGTMKRKDGGQFFVFPDYIIICSGHPKVKHIMRIQGVRVQPAGLPDFPSATEVTFEDQQCLFEIADPALKQRFESVVAEKLEYYGALESLEM